MWLLIRRELEGKDSSDFGQLRGYLPLGIIVALSIYLFGPRVTGLLDVGKINSFLSILGVILVLGSLSERLEKDDANYQMTFLQTLPVRKSQIVHAKFLNILFLCALMFVVLYIFISLNRWMNGVWMLAPWTELYAFMSFLLFLSAVTLFFYFKLGYQRIQWVFLLSLLIWGGAFMLIGSIMQYARFPVHPSLSLIISLILYFISWGMAVRKVNIKGIPDEFGSDYSSGD
ncbi:ABC-2 transporter permease [Lentibacillus lipolyticus]|nr:ABC-2 transporter permease [Lentibacillus lipolyticus]